jgi:gamma-glutamylcyclotransferase (GGCT)/AIG2-like uncharacterized protein YtfP
MAVYFAYGSNLDWQNWSEFCARHGADPRCMTPIAPALLPDVELVFNYRSVLREGGALNIRPRKGQVVHGVLYDVDERGWEVLDLKESVAAGCYERIRSVAITGGGQITPVVTYVVTPARIEGFVAPSEEYSQIVRRGLSAHGLATDQYDQCAQDVRPDPEVEGVFVYGTLMRDEARFGEIEKHGPAELLDGRMRGRLYETAADYPMLDLEKLHGDDVAHRGDVGKSSDVGKSDGIGNSVGKKSDVVHGELVHFSDLAPVLETLDEIEEFAGYASQHNEYVRTLVEVETCEANSRHAWTYVAADRAALGRRIDSGCWRTFRGVRRPQPLEQIN